MTDLDRENRKLRDRWVRISRAILRISETLDYESVLDEVVDSARVLTAARYGVITLVDKEGCVQSITTSGMTQEEYTALGLPELWPPPPSAASYLAAPIRRRDEYLGTIHVGPKESGPRFTSEDEETLVMFASHVAMVIANARRHRDEHQARTHLENLMESSPVGVMVFNATTGNLVSVNREAERIISMLQGPDQPREEFLRVSSLVRLNGRQILLDRKSLAEAFGCGEKVRAEEVHIRGPGGRRLAVIVNATPVPSKDGELDAFAVTMQDMTPLKEGERLPGEFLETVSDQLRAPLSTIKGSVETLLEEFSDLHPAEKLQFHRIILDQTKHMQLMIRDLLDVTLIETGSFQVSTEPTRLVVLVDQAKNRFLHGGGESSLHIELPSYLPPVMADRHRIVQVLGNLLSNVDRHSPESSVIRLTVKMEGAHAVIVVEEDEGVGISSEQLARLFRRFAGLSGRERSGLGLAICKGIVEAHGGRIWADSEGLGRRNRFVFTLPIVEEIRTPVHLLGDGDEVGRRVLAVDDDPDSLKYVRDTLITAGYVPVLTGDPTNIPRLMEEKRPDLVLLDLMLPGADGLKLMQSHFRSSDVPVIFLSLYGHDDAIARAMALGAVDYIVKPFSQTELAARIDTALKRQVMPRVPEDYVFGDLTISFAKREVTLRGQPVYLTGIEYRMLFELSANAGRVLTYDHLLRAVWGPENSGDLRPMRTVVRALRQKLDDAAGNPRYIFTEPRVGYLMAMGS